MTDYEMDLEILEQLQELEKNADTAEKARDVAEIYENVYSTLVEDSENNEEILQCEQSMLNAIKCGRKSKLDSVSFLGDGIRNVIINEEIYSSFTKYTIMQELEEILDKGLYKPNSELEKNTKVIVKKITEDYSRLRDKTLFELEKFEK